MDIDFSSEKLINVDLEQTMKTSFIQYSMSVITDRALPDVRDGLKPGSPTYHLYDERRRKHRG